jgi:hypothetical protein
MRRAWVRLFPKEAANQSRKRWRLGAGRDKNRVAGREGSRRYRERHAERLLEERRVRDAAQRDARRERDAANREVWRDYYTMNREERLAFQLEYDILASQGVTLPPRPRRPAPLGSRDRYPRIRR